MISKLVISKVWEEELPTNEDNWRFESLRLIKPLWLNSMEIVVDSLFPLPAEVASISTKVLVPK